MAISPAFFPRHLFPVLDQSRTLAARHDLCVQHAQRLISIQDFFLKTSRKTTPWLCSSSFAPNSSVTVLCSFSALRTFAINGAFFASSARYRFWKSGQRSGLWPNHLRSASLGPISFIHSSSLALSFF